MIRERHSKHGGRHHRQHSTRRVQGTLQPWLLLLLLQKPSHGYELMERLSQSEKIPDVDPGFLYRTLRHLEYDGWVHSSWNMEGEGPARRLYQVTPEGSEYLRTWAADIHLLQQQLSNFQTEYEAYLKTEKQK
ncbi:helix-turn-helix transcriptional regulator [Chloroflexota bacterium]